MKKWWVKLLLVLAAVVLVLAVLVATSSVHSKSAVERYKDQLRAAGENLDLKELLPPHVDSDKNGVELFRQAVPALPTVGILATNAPAMMKLVAPGKAMVGWQQADIWDDTVQGTNSWADLDQELQMGGATIDLLRQASERPQLNFELDYSQGFTLLLPHLSKIKESALLLSASAMANLHRGDSAAGATNLHTMLVLLEHWKDEPLLISQLVRMAIAQITFTAQWEFLQSTNVTDPQLAMLQRDWSNLQLVAPMENSLITERVWGARTIEQLRTSNSPSSAYGGWGGATYRGGGSGDWIDGLKDLTAGVRRRASDNLWRVSWSYDDELAVLQGDEVLIETVRQVRTNGFFKNALADRDRKLAALGFNRPGGNWLRNHMDDELGMLGGETIESIARSLERLQNCETFRVLTVTAIALKRYQLRHQTYPGDLNALAPEFLPEVPRDPVDGHPLRYQMLPNGAFLLYSIGSDNVDNGGDPNAAPGSKSVQWQRARDWVWPQPATPQEIEFFRANPPK
jgi:hypothetical protein